MHPKPKYVFSVQCSVHVGNGEKEYTFKKWTIVYFSKTPHPILLKIYSGNITVKRIKGRCQKHPEGGYAFFWGGGLKNINKKLGEGRYK